MHPMRVLVVDDEVRLAAAVQRGLQAEGFTVDVAHTGLEGLWAATEHRYDAALSRATVSTVLGVVGVVGVGAGAALWIVGKPSSASVGTDGQRLLVGRTF